MLILERYLLRHFVKVLIACLLTFIFLYIVIDVFSSMQEIVKNHPPVVKILEYYLYTVPSMFSQIAPIALLLATLFTLGNFNQANEIVAMRASGLSVFAIVRPLLTLAFILSLGIFVMGETLMPITQKASRFIRQNYIDNHEGHVADIPMENIAVYGFNNRLFFITKLYKRSHTIEGLTVLEHDKDQNVKTKIYAEKAVWKDNQWLLYNCFIYHLGDYEKNIQSEPLYYEQTTLKIPETPDDFIRQNVSVDDMTIKELSAYVGKLSSTGANAAIRNMQVDLFQKTSMPFTGFIIVLLGIPTSIVVRRRAVAFSSIGLCIGISFFFYVCFAVSVALGKTGIFPPWIAAWLSHLLFGMAALYMLSKIP